MGQVLLFSLTAMANPSLVAAVTVMLLLDNPKALMLGYLCGALLTSITLGIVLVFAAENLGIAQTGKHTLNPIADLVLGTLLLIIAAVLRGGRDKALRERRRSANAPSRRDGRRRRPRGSGCSARATPGSRSSSA